MGPVEVREIRGGAEWNRLVLAFPGHDLRQSFEWGTLRSGDGWIPHRYAVFDGEACVAAISVLARRLPGSSLSVLYASRGPLVDAKSEPAWAGLMEAVRGVAAATRAVFLRVSPNVPHGQPGFAEALERLGFVALADDWTTWNASRAVMTLDVSPPLDEVRRRFRRRHREYIASAARRGLLVRRATSLADVRAFHLGLVASGRSKGFPVRGVGYFEDIWREYLATGTGVLFLGEHEGALVGGLLGARFGRRAYMLYTLVRDEAPGRPDLHQGPPLWWAFIQWAKAAGCDAIDFAGTGTDFPPEPGAAGYGIYHYKLGFGCSLEYLASYADLPFRPGLYRLLRLGERSLAEPAWKLRARWNR